MPRPNAVPSDDPLRDLLASTPSHVFGVRIQRSGASSSFRTQLGRPSSFKFQPPIRCRNPDSGSWASTTSRLSNLTFINTPAWVSASLPYNSLMGTEVFHRHRRWSAQAMNSSYYGTKESGTRSASKDGRHAQRPWRLSELGMPKYSGHKQPLLNNACRHGKCLFHVKTGFTVPSLWSIVLPIADLYHAIIENFKLPHEL